MPHLDFYQIKSNSDSVSNDKPNIELNIEPNIEPNILTPLNLHTAPEVSLCAIFFPLVLD